MKFNLILSCFVAILALVNPIQKVLIVTSLQERFSPTELRYISIKSTITAMLILIFFLYLGQVTFSYVFRVELYPFSNSSLNILQVAALEKSINPDASKIFICLYPILASIKLSDINSNLFFSKYK